MHALCIYRRSSEKSARNGIEPAAFRPLHTAGAILAAGGTFLSYVRVVVGQKRLRPTVAGMYNYLQPVVASVVAVCWGMDTFDTVKAAAVALVFGGVYLVTVSPGRRRGRLPAGME